MNSSQLPEDDVAIKVAKYFWILIIGAGIGLLTAKQVLVAPTQSPPAVDESLQPFIIPDSFFSDQPIPDVKTKIETSTDEEVDHHRQNIFSRGGQSVGFGAMVGVLFGFMLFVTATIRPLPISASDSLETRQVILSALPLPLIGGVCGGLIGAMQWLVFAMMGSFIPMQFTLYVGAVSGALSALALLIGVGKFTRARIQTTQRRR